MPTIRPVHSAPISLMSGSVNWSNLGTLLLGTFDTNTLKISDLLLSLDFSFQGVSANSYLYLYMVASPDGALWPSETASAALEIATVPGDTNTIWTGMLSRSVGTLPPFFRIYARNNMGYDSNSAYNSRVFANYTTYEYV